MAEFALGYNREAEDVDRLWADAVPWVAPRSYSAPASVSIRDWFVIRNQGGKGSCTGHGRTGCSEVCNYLDTGGSVIRLSADWAYYTNQRACGLLGSDRGATIMGAIDSAKKDGECREVTMPYSEAYNPRFPEAAREEASHHLIKRHSILKSPAEWYSWLSTGQGPILIGMPWLRSFANYRGTKKTPIVDIGRGSLGGHCVFCSGYFLDENGDLVFEDPNSHSREYGDNGYFWLHQKGLEQLYNNDWFEAVGVSDIEEYQDPVVRKVVADFWPENPDPRGDS